MLVEQISLGILPRVFGSGQSLITPEFEVRGSLLHVAVFDQVMLSKLSFANFLLETVSRR